MEYLDLSEYAVFQAMICSNRDEYLADESGISSIPRKHKGILFLPAAERSPPFSTPIKIFKVFPAFKSTTFSISAFPLFFGEHEWLMLCSFSAASVFLFFYVFVVFVPCTFSSRTLPPLPLLVRE